MARYVIPANAAASEFHRKWKKSMINRFNRQTRWSNALQSGWRSNRDKKEVVSRYPTIKKRQKLTILRLNGPRRQDKEAILQQTSWIFFLLFRNGKWAFLFTYCLGFLRSEVGVRQWDDYQVCHFCFSICVLYWHGCINCTNAIIMQQQQQQQPAWSSLFCWDERGKQARALGLAWLGPVALVHDVGHRAKKKCREKKTRWLSSLKCHNDPNEEIGNKITVVM